MNLNGKCSCLNKKSGKAPKASSFLPMDSKRVRFGRWLMSVSGAAGRMSEVLSPWEEMSGLSVTSYLVNN